MKGKELGKIVDKYARSLEKYCKRIPGSFTIEDIHDLRVDYKRLRAFIRLCQEEAHTRNLQVPEPLKEVYKAAGQVRDHQLFLAKINLLAKVPVAIPEFAKCIQQELFRAKEILIEKIEAVEWSKLRKSIQSALPTALHDTAIRQFVNRKVAGIHILLLAAEKEEDLHDMRKHMKDLLHVSRIFENDWAIPFPCPAWETEKPVNDLTEKLGDFNDECITLCFLQAACRENIPAGERAHIEAWHQRQLQQVEAGKKKLLPEIQQVNFNSQSAPVK